MANQKNTKQAKTAAKSAAASTQTYLNIDEIKDGVLVLQDGSLRSVLMCSALNFALKSASEQDAIIYAYQRFLNSLTFPVQILVQSRRLDLEDYINKLAKRADEQENELIKLQILEYVEFIKRLISVTNIMDKRFFVIVPFYPTGTEPAKGFFSSLFSTKATRAKEAKAREEQFERGKVQLMQRVEAIASGLGAVGLRAATLTSEELVELFYSVYNPGTALNQRVVNVDDLTGAQVRGSELATEHAPEMPDASAPKQQSAQAVVDDAINETQEVA